MPQEKKQQQRQVIHVETVHAHDHYYFGSLPAIFLFFKPENMGVSKSTLDRWDFAQDGAYENEKVIIRIGTLQTPGALRKMKEKEFDDTAF